MSAPAARILVVDDELHNRSLLQLQLQPEGYEVQTAASGEEALAQIARRAPDLILLDIMMPGMDGYQVAGAVKADPATSNIPIIMITASVGRAAHMAGLKSGAEEFLTKPVDRSELYLRVRNLLRLKTLGDFFKNHSTILEREVKARTASLSASEERFRQMAENIGDVFYLRDADGGRMLYVSPAYEEIWGRSCQSLYDDPASWSAAVHPEDRAMARAKNESGVLSGKFDFEYRIVRPDGSIRWIQTKGFPVRSDADPVARIAGVAEDITERKTAEIGVKRLNRVYALLSQINALIVRVTDRDELFREACRIAVGPGGFKLAWIAVVEHGAMQLKPVAWEGAAQEYLERVPLGLDPADPMFGLAGQAVRDRRPVIVEDMEHDPRVLLRSEARERDFRSLVMLPLVVSDTVVGVLALYSNEVGFFNAGEMKLLIELAGDISFAIDHIEAAAKLERTTRVNAMLSAVNAAIVRIRDPQELFEEACRITVSAGGFILARVIEIDPNGKAGIAATTETDSQRYQQVVDGYNADPAGSASLLAHVIRSGQPEVINDVATDPRVPGRAGLTTDGSYALALLPIVVDRRVAGVVTLRARESGMFDEGEMRLLLELVSNIAFALEHMGKQERLDYLAYYDVLTGLANRGLFLERVAQYMRSATRDGHRLAIFLIDLERFKNINDSLGQAAGDALLKQVAEWLGQKVADINLLARIGADHFAVVLPKVSADGSVARLLDGAMDAFEEHPFHLQGGVFRIATKSGVALFPDDGDSADALFKNAEAALKKAKAGGNRYLFYSQQMTEAVAGRLTLENQLRGALGKGEFVLHYQPKVDLVSGTLTGAEALIRWNDPLTGLVPPGRFIPILEETGMIGEVGRWALRTAVEVYLGWLDAGLPAVRVAVNVSPLQLRHPDFVAELAQAIAIDARAPAGLEIEITENLVMEDIKRSIASLRAIRALGVTIAIDDFGTGFSSLSYLSRLPVDTLKIDRSFVTDMTAREGTSLVPAIIGLAHSLKLKVVAEGVETEDQSRLLRLLGCDEMQGYLFGKPVPREIFEATYLVRRLTK